MKTLPWLAPALMLASPIAVAGSADAQLRRLDRGVSGLAARPISPALAERLAQLGRLAELPDGSYIDRINGRGAPVTMRNGMTLVIMGKGFDQRRDLSLVGLFASDAAGTGAMLKVIDWSDTRIVALVPPDQTWLRADTDRARLSVQVVRANGVQQSLIVRNIRYRTR